MTDPPRFDARRLFLALARHEVRYLTIGGVAVQAHGGQRVTQDLDIAIDPSGPNAERLASALVDLDARVVGPDGTRSGTPPSATMLRSSDQWHLISEHGALDVMTLPAALGTFDAVRARAHDVDLGDVTVPVVSRDDLLTMKRAAGRPQDLADVEALETLPPDG